MTMTHPTHSWVYSAYPPGADKPTTVDLWEQQIGAATTPEQATAQMTYALAVEIYRMRRVVTAILVIIAVSTGIGLLGALIVLLS